MGKKIFFLYPLGDVLAQIIQRMISSEYEVYRLQKHAEVLALIAGFSDSIIFINIDAGLSLADWKKFIQNFSSDPATKSALVGLISENMQFSDQTEWLDSLSAYCGSVRLAAGLEEAAETVLAITDANGAMGQRQYVRFGGQGLEIAKFSFKFNAREHAGTVHDISSAGMSCTFETAIECDVGDSIGDIVLKLGESISTISGRIIVKRRHDDEHDLFVVMFDKRLVAATRDSLHNFIHHSLQAQMDEKLANLT